VIERLGRENLDEIEATVRRYNIQWTGNERASYRSPSRRGNSRIWLKRRDWRNEMVTTWSY